MLRVREITEPSDLPKIEDMWNRLLIEAETDNPYLSFGWFRTAFESFEKSERLCVLIVEDDDRAIALAPLIISVRQFNGFTIKKLHFLTNVYTPFQDFILTQKKSEALVIILDYLLRNFRLWDLMELKEIRNESESRRILEEFCKNKNLYYHQFFSSRSWCVSTNDSFEEGLTNITPKTQKEFRRKIRRIENLGRLSFQIITEYKEIERHLDIFFELYKQTWKGEESRPEFYYRISQVFSKENNCILYCLLLNDRPIAYMFGLKIKQTLFGVKTTYDPAYYAYAPGIILFYKILENSFHDNEIKKFDIGRGEERYKQELGSQPILQSNIIAGHKKSVFSYLYYLRYALSTYLNARKATMHIVTILKYTGNFIIAIPKYIKKFKTFLFRHDSEIIFYKKLDIVDHGNQKSDLKCKKADFEDIDQLAVAMKAKNLKDINERIEEENCFIVLKDGMICNYFWFDKNVVNFGIPENNDEHVVLIEFESLRSKMDKDFLNKAFNVVCNELVKYQYKSLFAISRSTDCQRIMTFNFLEFQMFKLITIFTIFNISFKHTRKIIPKVNL